jgi:DNA repair photolyase
MAGHREPPRDSPIRGRGTRVAPPNRFESAAFVPEPVEGAEFDDPAPDPRTRYLRDASRSALAKNDSPDVGFDVSINPYRGCEHGCVYCLDPTTPVLFSDMTWRPLGEVRVGDTLVGFDEFPVRGSTRKLRAAQVQAVWRSRKPALRLITRSADVHTTAEHRWLLARSSRWLRTSRLAPGKSLRRIPVVVAPSVDDDYRAGYVAAAWHGEPTDRERLERLLEYLKCFGVAASVRASRVGVGSPAGLEIVDKLLHVERASSSYRRGFLAGSFDAELPVDLGVLERVRGYGASLGFEFVLERRARGASTLRLLGSTAARMRFFATVQPAIRRKLESVFGREPASVAEPIEAIERAGVRDVVDIQTSTGTFFAAGLATHNCYARPTHEYLGFSSGLDFETRILVKHELPELLRSQLSRRSWKPQVVALSGVTDCYQPIERKLRHTRRCLEVLAGFRNPCSIITKSRLVARDADVLQELARHQAVSVTLSLTTLDPDLARLMEPRAAQPRARLAAVEALARAGVPVGVNLAPIVPGLTDHEIPKLAEAAAGAGAQWAGWVMLRLPYSVKDLFAQWLADHFPDRRDKILHRIAAVRDGKLYQTQFGVRQRGTGLFAEQIADLVALARRRHGLAARGPELSTASFKPPGGDQLALL